ncbi:MAG: DUF1569 domain-containing protein [Phycisphaerae bacterium]
MPDTVDTRRVRDRRPLRFETIDALLAEVDRIEAADAAGRLRCIGNWSAGQVMGHVAAWIDYGYDGYPLKPPPWPIRVVLRFLKGRYLRNGMPVGRRIPGVPDGTYGTEPMSTAAGAAALRRAARRLASGEPARFPSPAFGPMPESERIALNLRHAELHLGFLHA